ncbi:MAG: CDP-alcohol phosphatidyltransferase family protein [Coxiellaceae bacterium]|nr:CDP-alcohol phosphatidyltransferase family protein [Coxiellaceae bacterium]
MNNRPSYLYWPNLIDYLRLVLFAIFLIAAFSAPMLALCCFVIAALCDALDGYLARKLNQQSHLGMALDFTIDRVVTAALLLILARLYNHWWLFFCTIMTIDLGSHYMHLYRTSIMGGKNHKHAFKIKSRLLPIYYNNRTVLFTLCFCHDAWLASLYLYAFVPNHWVILPLVLFAPGFLVKTIIHLLQFYVACVDLNHSD